MSDYKKQLLSEQFSLANIVKTIPEGAEYVWEKQFFQILSNHIIRSYISNFNKTEKRFVLEESETEYVLTRYLDYVMLIKENDYESEPRFNKNISVENTLDEILDNHKLTSDIPDVISYSYLVLKLQEKSNCNKSTIDETIKLCERLTIATRGYTRKHFRSDAKMFLIEKSEETIIENDDKFIRKPPTVEQEETTKRLFEEADKQMRIHNPRMFNDEV